MAGIVTTTQIDNMSQTFIAKALETREHSPVMDKLVDTKTLPKGHGIAWNEPYVGSISASALTEGEEFDSPSQFTDTNIQITVGEVGVQVYIPKRSNDRVKEDLYGIAGRLMSNAIEYKRDTDLLGLLDGFGGSLGSGTATLVAGHITSAASSIRAGRAQSGGTARTGARSTGDPVTGPIHCVVHEYQRRALAAQFSGLFSGSSDGAISTTAPTQNFGTNRVGLSDWQVRWIKDHYRGQVDGIDIIVDNNLTIASNAAKGGVFGEMALVHVKYRAPFTKRVETDDGRLIKMTMVDDYGYGERNDIWGVELNVAAVTPTS